MEKTKISRDHISLEIIKTTQREGNKKMTEQ